MTREPCGLSAKYCGDPGSKYGGDSERIVASGKARLRGHICKWGLTWPIWIEAYRLIVREPLGNCFFWKWRLGSEDLFGIGGRNDAILTKRPNTSGGGQKNLVNYACKDGCLTAAHLQEPHHSRVILWNMPKSAVKTNCVHKIGLKELAVRFVKIRHVLRRIRDLSGCMCLQGRPWQDLRCQCGM